MHSGEGDFWERIDAMDRFRETCIEPRFPVLRRILTFPWRLLMFFPRLPFRLKYLEESHWIERQRIVALERRVGQLEGKEVK